jgi:hypothetical protein
MLLNRKSGTPGCLRRYSVNAAVANVSRRAARKADEMVMVRWFARDVRMAAVRKIKSLHKALLCE